MTTILTWEDFTYPLWIEDVSLSLTAFCTEPVITNENIITENYTLLATAGSVFTLSCYNEPLIVTNRNSTWNGKNRCVDETNQYT